MKKPRIGGPRSRLGAAASLTTLALCAAGLVLSGPAHADTGTSSSTSTSTSKSTPAPRGNPTVKPRIIGGEPVEALFEPWIVQVLYTSPSGEKSFCGGTAIAPTKVLTAGSCVAGRNMVAGGLVVVGGETPGSSESTTDVHVRAQWVHPDYQLADNGLTADNDLAILTVDQPLSDYYDYIPPPTDNSTYEPGLNPATEYGWGNSSSDPAATNDGVQLQKLTGDVNSDATCANALDTATGNPHAYVPGHMVCVGSGGTGDDSTGRTACLNDTGDPVLSSSGYLMGVVSWNAVHTATQSCNVPGDYDLVTKLSTYFGPIHQQVAGADITRDGKADILARTPAGESYLYESTGAGYKSRVPAPISLTNYDTVVQADFNLDGYQDFVLRATGTGNVFLASRSPQSAAYHYTLIGTNWKAVKSITSPGDVDGDGGGTPDLEVEDSSGRMWTYGSRGDGTFWAPFANQANLGAYNTVIGHGDFNSDGYQDLIARNAANGNLYLIPGTPGNEYIRYLDPILISGGWKGYDKLVTVGDYNGDGHPDLLARTPSGALFLYKGTGNSGPTTFTSSVKIGTGWTMYDLLG